MIYLRFQLLHLIELRLLRACQQTLDMLEVVASLRLLPLSGHHPNDLIGFERILSSITTTACVAIDLIFDR